MVDSRQKTSDEIFGNQKMLGSLFRKAFHYKKKINRRSAAPIVRFSWR